ncbi:MAG: ribosomal protein S18-alanine N-acetyltransferase [Anaerolineae bacterium]|jgi:ribosomal-protein-alanine N-acetyltransferase|nr:ribosomal protein S18-alanine N-acetyltransferase [Anaerolineae bacterium]
MTLPLISPMQPEDLDAIMPLERLAFADPWSRRMYLSDLHENPLATYRVIRPANGVDLPPILGWGGFWLLVDEAHIATVAAHPEHRGCGLGEMLMVDLMERAVERGARVATLEVRASNLVAQKLYAKLGFDVVGTRRKYYRDGEDGLIMTTPELDDPEIMARMDAARADALARVARCFSDGA